MEKKDEENIPLSIRQASFSSLHGVIITKGGERLDSMPELFSCSLADDEHSTSSNSNFASATLPVVKSPIQRKIAVQIYSSCSSFFGQDEEEDYNSDVIIIKQLAISNGERWDKIGYNPSRNILETVRRNALRRNGKCISNSMNLPIIDEDERQVNYVKLPTSSHSGVSSDLISRKNKSYADDKIPNHTNILKKDNTHNIECLMSDINSLESLETKRYQQIILNLKNEKKNEIKKIKPLLCNKTNSIIEDLKLCIESAISIGNKKKAYKLIIKLQEEEHKLNAYSDEDYIPKRKLYEKKKRIIKEKFSKKENEAKGRYQEIKKSLSLEKEKLQTSYILSNPLSNYISFNE